jgi:polysaccharide export outer membrane protein
MFSALLLGACSSHPPSAGFAPDGAVMMPANSTGFAGNSQRSGSDTISPQDLLDISVFKVPDLSKTVRVDDNGTITLPLLGTIRAAGMSAKQLEQMIAGRLARDYMNDPQVSVFVKEATRSRVTVEGAVGKPGIFPMAGDMSFLQAIATAGGLTRLADPNNAVLFRGANRYRVNLAAIRTGAAADPAMMADDRIVVQESAGKVFFDNARGLVAPFTLF